MNCLVQCMQWILRTDSLRGLGSTFRGVRRTLQPILPRFWTVSLQTRAFSTMTLFTLKNTMHRVSLDNKSILCNRKRRDEYHITAALCRDITWQTQSVCIPDVRQMISSSLWMVSSNVSDPHTLHKHCLSFFSFFDLSCPIEARTPYQQNVTSLRVVVISTDGGKGYMGGRLCPPISPLGHLQRPKTGPPWSSKMASVGAPQ